MSTPNLGDGTPTDVAVVPSVADARSAYPAAQAVPGGHPNTQRLVAFGQQIRRRRETHGMSQQLLGDLCNRSAGQISAIEGGQPVGYLTMLRLADALDVPLWRLELDAEIAWLDQANGVSAA